MNYGLFDVEVKFSIFLFPLIFSTADSISLQKEKITAILFSFIVGCFTATIFFYAHALYNLVVNDAGSAFYYEQLSWYFHPSYLAMYLTVAIAILAYWFMEGYAVFNRYQITGTILLLLYFSVFIVLLNSKAGLLTLIMVIIVYSGLLIIFKHNWRWGLGLLMIPLLIYAGLTLFPDLGKRFKEAGSDIQSLDTKGKDPKSTAQRILIWKSSFELIREHPLFGVGTGDVKDALMEKYKANNLTKILAEKLNAHNQYLQTFISIGVFGFMALVFMLVAPAVHAFQRKDFVYFLFLIIFAVNIGVESMLENQAGVIFYALFNSILFASCHHDPGDNPSSDR